MLHTSWLAVHEALHAPHTTRPSPKLLATQHWMRHHTRHPPPAARAASNTATCGRVVPACSSRHTQHDVLGPRIPGPVQGSPGGLHNQTRVSLIGCTARLGFPG